MNMNIINIVNQNIVPWLLSSGFKILIIIISAWVLSKIIHSFIERIIRKAIPAHSFKSPMAEKKREDTLIRIFDGSLSVIVWIVAMIMIISEFNVDIGPLLAGAGLIGVAFGFGAQYLVRDLITGLFLIIENQFRVGDYVCLGGTCGTVENITLRVTVLRDADGIVHTIPNGEIKVTSNESKDFSGINLTIGVSYDSDVDKVRDVVNAVGEKLISDDEWKDLIIEAPLFSRIQSFDDSAVIIRISGKVKPLSQWVVAGELRRRLKIAFDTDGIEFPFPQRVVRNINIEK
ncbi:MAG: small-conductance mechanosensitive channel [Flavobacteriaceae bacterium]|jgi:small-conductance mechanosensitive channel